MAEPTQPSSKTISNAAAGDVAPTSAAVAADASLFELWDRSTPFPPANLMQDLDVVTHVRVEQPFDALGNVKYRYLHDSRIAFHNDRLYMTWANHRDGEVHFNDAKIRGSWSDDLGLTWREPLTFAEAPMQGAECFNHSVMISHAGLLWGFFTCFNDKQPRCEIFTLDEASQTWRPCNAHVPGLVPFQRPMQLQNGSWIISGEDTWYKPAVALSDGDDFTSWRLIHIPFDEGMPMEFPETAVIDQGDRLVAVVRPKKGPSALVSLSHDLGQSWSKLQPSNFPLTAAQPAAIRLSTGRQLLLTNNLEEGRTLLTIAATDPGSRTFSKIWKLRHQAWPIRRVFTGVFFRGNLHLPMLHKPTEWSYPSAFERDGNLYVSYTQGKEACCLSIIPIRVFN